MNEAVRRENVRRADRKFDRQQWIYPLVTVFVTMAIAVSANIVYTTMAIRRGEQNWCDIVTGLDDRYHQIPPDADPAAKKFAGQIHYLRVTKLHCK